MLVNITLFVALILTMVVPTVAFYLGEKSQKRFKTSLFSNIISFALMFVLATIVMFSNTAFAAETVDATNTSLAVGLGYIAAALAVGISGIGGGIAVANSASAAIGSLSEGGKFGTAIVFVGLAEGIALYGLVIAFMILSKLPALG